MLLTPNYQERLKRGLYVFDYCSMQPIDKHRLEPARMGERLQQVKENHPNKTYDGQAMQIQNSVMEPNGSDMILSTPPYPRR